MTDLKPTDLPPPDPATRNLPAASEPPAGSEAGSLLRLLPLAALFVLLGVRGGWEPVVIVTSIVVMIFLHEMGHFLTAKWTGMKVTEFFIGFGPRIWSFRRGDTEYGLKAIPLGAYVKTPGMYAFEEVTPADEPVTFRAQPTWQRVLMASGGSIMHFLQAGLAFLLLVTLAGFPNQDRFAIDSTEPGSPAAEAGLLPGDEIVAIDGVRTDTDGIIQAIGESQGRPLDVQVLRDGAVLHFTIAPEVLPTVGGDRYRIGILRRNVLEKGSVGDAFTTYGESFELTITGLGDLFSPGGFSDYTNLVLGRENNSPTVGSPAPTPSDTPRPSSVIGIVDQGSDLLGDGWTGFLMFYAAVNVAIGIFNLMPLLPFDGGHIVIALYEKVRSRRGKRHYADVQKLLPLTYAVVLILLFLFVSSAYLDVKDL